MNDRNPTAPTPESDPSIWVQWPDGRNERLPNAGAFERSWVQFTEQRLYDAKGVWTHTRVTGQYADREGVARGYVALVDRKIATETVADARDSIVQALQASYAMRHARGLAP